MGKRNFAFYFKASYKNAKAIWKNKSDYFGLLINLLMNIISFALLPLRPFVALINVRTTVDAKYKNRFQNTLACERITGVNYWKLSASSLIKFMLFAAFGLLIVLAGLLLAFLGLTIGTLAGADQILIMMIFAVPAVIALILYLVAIPAITVPCAYIIDANPDLEIHEILKLSFEKLKNETKVKLFINNLVLVGIKTVYIVLVTLIFLLFTSSVELLLVGIILLIGFIAAYVVFDPIISFTARLFVLNLFEDELSDIYCGNCMVSGVNVRIEKPVTYTKRESDNYKSEVEKLFDATEKYSNPLKSLKQKLLRLKPVENPVNDSYDVHDGEPLPIDKTQTVITDEMAEKLNEKKIKSKKEKKPDYEEIRVSEDETEDKQEPQSLENAEIITESSADAEKEESESVALESFDEGVKEPDVQDENETENEEVNEEEGEE